MDNQKLKEQVAIVNKSLHILIYGQMLSRSDFISEKMRGLSQIEIHIISLTYEKPDMIMREIREYLKLPQTTLSSMVAKLEKRNLIQRVINRRDMRSFSLKVTSDGKEVVEEHRRMDREQITQLLMGLNEKERDDFTRLINKAAENVGLPKALIDP